jgi:hypothetical protein
MLDITKPMQFREPYYGTIIDIIPNPNGEKDSKLIVNFVRDKIVYTAFRQSTGRMEVEELNGDVINIPEKNYLDKLKEMYEKATPGSWAYTQCADSCEIVYESNTKTSGPFSEQDARLICTMRAYLPELLAVADASAKVMTLTDHDWTGPHKELDEALMALEEKVEGV